MHLDGVEGDIMLLHIIDLGDINDEGVCAKAEFIHADDKDLEDERDPRDDVVDENFYHKMKLKNKNML